MKPQKSTIVDSIKQLPGGVVHIRFSNENLISFDLLREIKSIVNDLLDGPVESFLITIPDFPQAEHKFWKKLRRLEHYMNGKPTAIICPNSGMRLLAQGYHAIYNPNQPYRIFKSFESGYNWLTNTESRTMENRIGIYNNEILVQFA